MDEIHETSTGKKIPVDQSISLRIQVNDKKTQVVLFKTVKAMFMIVIESIKPVLQNTDSDFNDDIQL